MKKIKAYKVFNNDWTCNDFQYEVGKSYHVGDIGMCIRGFHACKKIQDCFNYYPLVQWNKYAEVELSGEILGIGSDKQCAGDIKIVKELSFDEVLVLMKNSESKGVNRSNGLNQSSGVSWSTGLNQSSGVSWSNGLNRSSGVNESNGINQSEGVSWSNGVSYSDGVNHSNGVSQSKGVNYSCGILDCLGISHGLFTIDKKPDYLFFGKKITKKRWETIYFDFFRHLNGWKPLYNNLKSLFIKNGNHWKSTPIPFARELQTEEAWSGMPKEAIEYLKSEKGFDEKIFKKITGIEIKY